MISDLHKTNCRRRAQMLLNTWAPDTGRFIQKNGEFIFMEDQDSALRLLLERAVKQGMITQEEYDSVQKASQARARATSRGRQGTEYVGER